jgi:hypothetical protein
MYEQLKSYVVDPFDDTPEAVIGRLIEIVDKAKSRWSPFEEEIAGTRRPQPQVEPEPEPEPEPQAQHVPQVEPDDEVVLL